MTQSENREKHLNYVGMQATRDVSRVFMWIKLCVGTMGLLYVFGSFLFSKEKIGSEAGAYVYISFVPLIILILGLWDLLMINLSKFVEHRLRGNDRRGRSNNWNLIAVTIGGFIFLHLVMLKFLGSGYASTVLTGGPDGQDPLALFMVFGPYVAFSALMLYYWLTPPESSGEMPEAEEIALAEEKRASQRLAIFAIYAVAIALGAAIIFVFGN